MAMLTRLGRLLEADACVCESSVYDVRIQFTQSHVADTVCVSGTLMFLVQNCEKRFARASEMAQIRIVIRQCKLED